MKAVDFSCKHDILIRHKDGTLTPMDEPYYEVTEITPNTWQIMSSGDYHYLLAGDDEAIAIDTGYGAGNLREFLESLCGKPVRAVINTHHHFDHSANNCYFDLAYMAEESVPLAAIPYASFAGIDFPRDYEVHVVSDGDQIDLKGRPLTIYKIGDHTDGGIAIFDPTAGLMFTGDEIMPNGKKISGTLKKFINDMGKLMQHRAEFDRLCGGPAILPAEELDIFYEAGKLMLSGELKPIQGEPMRPLRHEEERSPDGKLIYDCQHPHPGDGGAGAKPRVSQGEILRYEYKGRSFMCHEGSF